MPQRSRGSQRGKGTWAWSGSADGFAKPEWTAASTSRAPHQGVAAPHDVRQTPGCMTKACTRSGSDLGLRPAPAPPLAIPCHSTCYSVAIPGGAPRGMEGNGGASTTASFSLARRCFRRLQRDVARIGHSLLVNSSPLHPASLRSPLTLRSCGASSFSGSSPPSRLPGYCQELVRPALAAPPASPPSARRGCTSPRRTAPPSSA